jgi:hypothetical protein
VQVRQIKASFCAHHKQFERPKMVFLSKEMQEEKNSKSKVKNSSLKKLHLPLDEGLK